MALDETESSGSAGHLSNIRPLSFSRYSNECTFKRYEQMSVRCRERERLSSLIYGYIT